jgi:hypothetical protein
VSQRAKQYPRVAPIGLLCLALMAAGCGPNAAASPQPAPTITATPSVEPTATPTTTPVPSVAPPVVRAQALGRLEGNWIFAGKLVPYPHNVRAEVQIWAIPLNGGAARLAFAYDVSLGGVPEAIFDNTPYLRRVFSPDGARLVVSAAGDLVIIDIVSGRVTPLGVQGYYPSWSKDGSRMAFVHTEPVDQVVPPGNVIAVLSLDSPHVVTDLAAWGYSRGSAEWSPDGARILVGDGEQGTLIIDATSGRVVRRIAGTSAAFAHWRSATPQIAIATSGCDLATTRVIALDNVIAPVRTIFDAGERCAPITLRDPRWNPARPNELLYVLGRAVPGVEPSDYRARLVDVSAGTDTPLPLPAFEATWTWDGKGVVYLANAPGRPYGNAVRVWDRDTGAERELLRADGNAFFFSITSVNY